LNNPDGIVSLLLACIELVLMVNLLIFADRNKENFLILLIVLLLAGYQIFEYFICGIGSKTSDTVFLAFADISFLPPLSFILVLTYLEVKSKIKPVLLAPALFFVIYYAFVVDEFAVVKCTVLYAAYTYPLGTLYGAFYYLPIFISFVLLVVNLKKADELKSRQFKLLVTGYYFIIIPVIVSFVLLLLNLPGLLNSIESILCKFAFGYAVTLGFFALNNRTKA